MPTRISIPDGGSIAVVAPYLLDRQYWTIDDTSIISNFDVRGMSKVIVYPRQQGAGMHDPPNPKGSRFRFEPKDPIQSVDLQTGLGTIALGISNGKLELRLSVRSDLARTAVFTQWTKNPHVPGGDQAIEYHDPAVLIDVVIVNDALYFEREADRCRVDVIVDTAARDPFKQGFGQAE